MTRHNIPVGRMSGIPYRVGLFVVLNLRPAHLVPGIQLLSR